MQLIKEVGLAFNKEQKNLQLSALMMSEWSKMCQRVDGYFCAGQVFMFNDVSSWKSLLS